LPTIVLGALPGEPDWAARLARIGIDVAASGADEDTPGTLAAARAAAPHLPLKARAVDAGAFDGMGGLIVETPGDAPPGTYLLGDDDAAVEGVDGASDEVEDVMDVARRTLDAARDGIPSALWVVATPGLELLAPQVVEAKLTALADGARQARLYLAKEQFDT
jgi:methionine synthase II (cobalamin-independent)